MTYGAFSPGDFAAYDSAPRSENPISLPLLCGITLVASASVGLWMLYAPGPTTPDVASIPAPAPIEIAATPAEASMAAPPAAIGPLRRYAGFLDPTYSGGAVPGTFAQSAPLRAGFIPLNRRAAEPLAAPTVELRTADRDTTADATGAFKTASLDAAVTDIDVPQVVSPSPVVSEIQSDVPLPTPRPRFAEEVQQAMPAAAAAAQARVTPRQVATAAPAPAAPTQPGFFDKFFGKPKTGTAPAPTPQPAPTAMAYAAPQESLIGNLFAGRPASTAAVPERDTAVYDISAHTVYMPDGTQLEAHSGLGEALDNPNGVHLRMRGATPPNMYALTLRESLFHGVRAIRLTPIGNGETYGRAGLLAHTYMLRGRSGESNGCVVFRNYEAFLRAFDTGQVRRMVVVARRA